MDLPQRLLPDVEVDLPVGALRGVARLLGFR